MRFHLVDRIDELQPHRLVRARKLTSHHESHWRDQGRGPEMPAPLVLESLCQAGSWLVMASTGLRLRAVLLSIDAVTFTGPVRPGDTLRLCGEVESFGAERAALSGAAKVDGRVVLRADTILCALRPTAELEDLDDVRRTHDRLLRDAS
ncbi:3-hydroxyacyl-ACP dehydratase FabZ family protein [Actinocrispum wychmicini]|uniref:3-hydroxyacyl-[acyl-carrier-protein] dehydratase n=1 Tax=Actinocrispum wychmicini TaxID=1213861 RepID=A0A4V2S3L6_9PSEU|nr:3-hydroxylacyl-ACP dehydratase [Actinocrispum wychmicini]TCO44800.1 3-hydroxyacyl-[acyl-carrier-protein] dehydratase [Actinocrispum wychmicini]